MAIHCMVTLTAAFLLLMGAAGNILQGKPSEKTMKKLCEMPEFQRAMAADEELEPAAVVYEVMSKRLEGLETHIKKLEKKLEGTPTKKDIEAAASALKVELINHVEDRMQTMATEIEANIQVILKNLMTNLAGLGYEQGFGLGTEPPPPTTTEPPTKDCGYLASRGYESGIHTLVYNGKTFKGYCEIKKDQSAWLVIQRRVDATENFYRGWDDYKKGFGDMLANFYYGNSKIHKLTALGDYRLRIELRDSYGDVAIAEYSNFSISGEASGFILHYDKFIGGDAGDSLTKSKGRQFSTPDSDRDGSRLYSCSRLHKGAFWYDRCGSANLNGVFISDNPSLRTFNWQNIFWYSWKRDLRGLTSVKMLIRPST